MINNFSPEEKETVILSSDADNQWDIYNMQKKIINKMTRLNIQPYKTDLDEEGNIIAAYYKIPFSQLSFRKSMQLSDDQKEKKRVILEKARQNKK